MPTTVVLADDHAMFRKGLRLLLDAEEDILVVGEAGDGQTAIERVRELTPDVVVMDISMPGLNGIEATKAIVSEFPGIRVVALSIQSSKRFIDEMLRAGAAGYILKESAPEELIEAIKSVIGGDVFLSAAVTKTLVTELIEKDPEPQPASPGGGISADTGYEIPLLRTKLQRPYAPPDLVVRSHLLDRLDEMRRRPLTLVSAMAGCGKSTLASQWLTVFKGHGFWLSLDKDDNDLHLFLGYIVAAIRTELPTACEATSALLATTVVPPIEVIGRHFLNDLDEISEPFILVLDDYHHIRNMAVHDLISALLLHPPRHLHLILLCRRDPPLPISRLRGRGQVNEFGISDLRFTEAETKSFLEKRIDFPMDETRVATIYEKIEGWPAGMRLLSQSLMWHADPDLLIGGLVGGVASISEYLLSEVLQRQPSGMAEFMVATSILNRFCAPLCESLLSPGDTSHVDKISGAELIAWMHRENLFLIPLDSENKWFRYHHLFQDLLQGQLKLRNSPEQISTYHSRAGRWLGGEGFIEEALQHTLAAGDTEYAVKLIEQHRFSLMNEERWSRLNSLLQMFPDQVVEMYPELLLLRAWILYNAHRVPEMVEALELAEPLIDSITAEIDRAKSLRGEIYTLIAYKSNADADSEKAMRYLKKAIGMLHPDHILARGQVTASYCIARHTLGNQSVVPEVEEILPAGDPAYKSSCHSRGLAGYCFVDWIKGDLAGLLRDASQLLEYSKNWSLQETIYTAHYFSGISSYHGNDIRLAEKHLTLAVDNIYFANGIVGIHSCFALSLIYQNQGWAGKARETAEKAETFARELQSSHFIMWTEAFKAEIDLLQGRMDPARRWADQVDPNLFRSLVWFYFPPLTLVKVRLAQGTTASLRQATDLLDHLDDFVASVRNTRLRIDILALQALLNDRQGKEEMALRKLAVSLALAEPGGFIRNYMDLGPPMAGLLKQKQDHTSTGVYVKKILASFKSDEEMVVSEETVGTGSSPHQPRRPATPSQPLVEPLTNREIDVLELLAERLQNKEIADKLFVATETVKAHLKNIYQKLGVSKRREAVARAIELGILSGR